MGEKIHSCDRKTNLNLKWWSGLFKSWSQKHVRKILQHLFYFQSMDEKYIRGQTFFSLQFHFFSVFICNCFEHWTRRGKRKKEKVRKGFFSLLQLIPSPLTPSGTVVADASGILQCSGCSAFNQELCSPQTARCSHALHDWHHDWHHTISHWILGQKQFVEPATSSVTNKFCE